MSAGQEWTVTLGTGTSLVHDGELWTVTGLDGGAVTLRGRAGRSLRATRPGEYVLLDTTPLVICVVT